MVSFLLPSILEARMLITLCLFSISPYVWWLLDIGRHALCCRIHSSVAYAMLLLFFHVTQYRLDVMSRM